MNTHVLKSEIRMWLKSALFIQLFCGGWFTFAAPFDKVNWDDESLIRSRLLNHVMDFVGVSLSLNFKKWLDGILPTGIGGEL